MAKKTVRNRPGYSFVLLQRFSLSEIRDKRLSPRRAPRRSLLPLSPKRTKVRLKSLLTLVWLTPDPLRTHGRPSGQECRLRLKRPPPNASRRCPPTSEVVRQVEEREEFRFAMALT